MAETTSAVPTRSALTLTQQIFLGLAVGIIVGWFVSEYHPTWAPYFRPFSQLFLRLIKMIIAPLIFATLVTGIAGAGHVKVVGRMGLRALIYFEVITTLALVIGLLAVNVMRPGVGVSLPQVRSDIVAAPRRHFGRRKGARCGVEAEEVGERPADVDPDDHAHAGVTL